MSSRVYQLLRVTYWRLPLSQSLKERIASYLRRLMRGRTNQTVVADDQRELVLLRDYVAQVLAIPGRSGSEFVPLREDAVQVRADDPKIVAYYLPQFHPTAENDRWWGRGVTEWNNVSRAVPQFVGHYQPRLPGELGYYDLRLIENIERQVELARGHGVHSFCYYYYWFDGHRLLDRPLDAFVAARHIDYPFFLCWANESWTRRFDGTCGEILIQQSDTAESYRGFIDSAIGYMRDPRYVRVGGRPVLVVYRPSFVPDCRATLDAWREACVKAGVGEPYLIGVMEHTWNRDTDLLAHGFDAQSEFHPGTLFRHCKEITRELDFMRADFGGLVFDYADIVRSEKFRLPSGNKLHRAVMPMWDNTARRDHMGMIFHGSTPDLYGQWLREVLKETRQKVAARELDDSFVFINAWNEWGEGTYLEPDARFGYAYLEATRRALLQSRPQAA